MTVPTRFKGVSLQNNPKLDNAFWSLLILEHPNTNHTFAKACKLQKFQFCTNLISCTTILLKVQYGCPWLGNLPPAPITSQAIMPPIRMLEALLPLQLKLNWNSSWNTSLPHLGLCFNATNITRQSGFFPIRL